MAMWLYWHSTFLIADAITVFVPIVFPSFRPNVNIIDVASVISPFELSPGSFRREYMLPLHELCLVHMQIQSDGCEDQLYHALPVMLSWWIVGFAGVLFTNRHRCDMAVMATVGKEK
jgi:hypothetical protein